MWWPDLSVRRGEGVGLGEALEEGPRNQEQTAVERGLADLSWTRARVGGGAWVPDVPAQGRGGWEGHGEQGLGHTLPLSCCSAPGRGEGLSIFMWDSASWATRTCGNGASQPGLWTLGNSSEWCQAGSSCGPGRPWTCVSRR